MLCREKTLCPSRELFSLSSLLSFAFSRIRNSLETDMGRGGVSASKGRYRGTMRKEREGHHAAGRETTKTTMIIRCWRDLLHRSRVSPSREPPAAYSLLPRERCGISLASPEQRDLFREKPEGERRRESSRRRRIPLNKNKKINTNPRRPEASTSAPSRATSGPPG